MARRAEQLPHVRWPPDVPSARSGIPMPDLFLGRRISGMRGSTEMSHDTPDGPVRAVRKPGPLPGYHSFVSTRVGGVGLPPYDSLNLGFGTQDNPDHVLQNRKILSQAIHVPLGDFVVGRQVHSDRIAIVTESEKGRGVSAMAPPWTRLMPWSPMYRASA